MAIKRTVVDPTALFSIGLNVILTGSKKMTPDQQEELMSVGSVRVLIVDAEDEDNVLIDEVVEAREFSTGSVGYGLNVRDRVFSR